jgi:hypothetical protein
LWFGAQVQNLNSQDKSNYEAFSPTAVP